MKVARELRSKQNQGLKMFYTTNRRRLSKPAQRVVYDAAETVTGMRSVNDYWLPQILSEAIEAAETLGI
jgi:hypothetical protein